MKTQELLEHASWVRALARRIVKDADAAEDLAQETLVVALRQGPHGGVTLRAWLASVMRNLRHTRRRSELRRERRDREHLRAIEEPSTYELVEQAATERELVGLLLELEEPYRTTLLLRYFRDCSQKEIAERTGVPVSTVATRLSRGVVRLRESWVARHGEGPDGLRALVPVAWLAPVEAWRLGDPVGSLVTGYPWLAPALVTLVLVCGGAFWLGDGAGRHEPGERVRAGSPLGLAQRPAREEMGSQPGGASPIGVRALASTVVEPKPLGASAGTGVADASTTALVCGRVIDIAGDPVPDVEVVAVPPWCELDLAHGLPPVGVRLRTDPAGRFDAGLQGAHLFLAAREGWATLFAGMTPLQGGGDPLVVVAPAREVSGQVVDEVGDPVAGARIELVLDPLPLRRLGVTLDESMPLHYGVESDAKGRFVMRDVPFSNERAEASGEGTSRIVVMANGYLETFQDVPIAPGPLWIVLRRGDPLEAVQGVVRHADGREASGALVSAGQRSVQSDAEGRFFLNLRPRIADPMHVHAKGQLGGRESRTRPFTEHSLVAVLPGFLPARVELATDRDPHALIELQLGAPAPCLSGRVVDPHGTPRAGVEVIVLEETPFGLLPRSYGDGERGALQRAGVRLGSIESLLDPSLPSGTGMGRCPVTGSDGRFTIPGLLDREYRVEVQTSDGFFVATSEPVRPGDGEVVIVLHEEPQTIAGRLVDHLGEPIPGVRVSLSRRRGYSGPDDIAWSFSIGSSMITGADGGFELRGVSLQDTFLRLWGDPILPEVRRDLPAGMDPENLHLVASRRSYLQFSVPEPVVGCRLELRDANDRPLEGLFIEGNLMGPRPTIQADRAGLSAVYTISDMVRWVCILRDDEELARLPIGPVPGQVVRIEL